MIYFYLNSPKQNEFPILSRLHETYYEIPAFREALPENQPDAPG
jgi:maleylacetoacetate isomerase